VENIGLNAKSVDFQMKQTLSLLVIVIIPGLILETTDKLMSKYIKKPIPVEAHQWYQNGDHPEDKSEVVFPADGSAPFLGEGEVVMFLRSEKATDTCKECSMFYEDHGWIKTLEGGHIVCPGDWIITGIKGERYPCKKEIFEMTYEKIPGE
jgi:hypothetical protein